MKEFSHSSFFCNATLLLCLFCNSRGVKAQTKAADPMVGFLKHAAKTTHSATNLRKEFKEDSSRFRRIFDEELVNGKCYSNLHSLCFDIGERLSGTSRANLAVNWGVERLKAIGLDSVYTQAVMVPHWERGEKEKGFILIGGDKKRVSICALGGSVATPVGGIKGKVVMVYNLAELAKIGKKDIEGKIVFFNRAFDQRYIVTGEAYGNAVDQRVIGASEAVKFGAIGVIIRSMSSTLDSFPHTGIMIYKDGFAKIPAAALSTLAAEELTKDLQIDPNLEFQFTQNCKILPNVMSYNVVGEIKGKIFPNQVLLIGGHLDSWDLAQGAQDDGAGVVQSMEVLQLFKALSIRPERTIRVVLFMSEENGSSGGKVYASLAEKNKNQSLVAAIESDDGGFTPRGFGINTSETLKQKFESWKPLFVPYGASDFSYSDGSGGADIESLRMQSLALIGYNTDSQRYFDIHHTANDLFSQVNQRELKLGAASITGLVYLLDKYGL